MRVEQKVRCHDDGAEQIIEVVSNIAGKAADCLHLLLLVDLVFERALLGRFQRVDNRRFAVIVLLFLNGRDEKGRKPFVGTGERGFNWRYLALTFCGAADRGFQRAAIACRECREKRAISRPFVPEGGEEQVGELRIETSRSYPACPQWQLPSAYSERNT